MESDCQAEKLCSSVLGIECGSSIIFWIIVQRFISQPAVATSLH